MANDLILLIPLLIPVIAGVLLMLLEPFTSSGRKSHLAVLTVLAAAIAAYSLQFQGGELPRTLFGGMIIIDNFSIFFQWLFLIIVGISAALSMKFNER